MLHKLFLTALLLHFLTSSASTSLAQIPRTISYQGQGLQSGSPISGTHDVTVALYQQPTGGSAVYQETHTSVKFVSGVFDLLIGSIIPIPTSLSFDAPYYIGIRFDNGTELAPRAALSAAPYALFAHQASEAISLSPNATGAVTSINNQSGALTFEGAGTTTVSANGNTITIASTGGGGATGIQGVQSVNASIAITNGSGPVANLALNDNAVKTPNLFDAAVTTSKLANESVSTSKLADASITTSKVVDASITTAKLADGSITSDKLATDAVSTEKLADNAVTPSELATNAVTTEKIDTDAITSIKILDGTIATADLANASVTNAKINSTPGLNGQVLTADGSGAASWQAPTLALPFTATTVTGNPAFDIQLTGATGGAGRFRITNAANSSPGLNVTTTGTGSGMTIQLTNAGNGSRGIDVSHAGNGPGVFSTSAGGNALWGITTSISAAGVIGDNTFGEAVVGRTRGGNGVGAVVGRNDSSGYGVRGFNTKAGIGVLGQAGISGGTGVGGRFENVNAANTSNALEASTNGTGFAASFTNSNSGSSGSVLKASNSNLGRVALLQRGSGTATTTFAALQIENLSASGEGIWLRNGSSSSTNPAIKIHVDPSSTSAILLGTTWNGSGNPTNVVRIDKTGKGFFNGGTQNSGADVAEAFAVVGETSSYEAGDVLVIASGHTRTVQKCSTPYSTAVLGVHATKPGVLLTEVELDGNMTGLVPMAVVGVVPTKVTNEGGVIHAGDLLVTSSTPGHAMRADPSKLGFGMILGKALQDLDGQSGMIQVFVNVR